MDLLIDQIYEAAVVPELWPEVLGEVADIAGAEGAIMIGIRGDAFGWLCSNRIAEHAAAYFGAGHQFVDDRTARLLRRGHPGFLVDYDVFTPDEFRRDPVMNDFFRPRGMGWGVATSVHVPSGDTFVFHCERRFQTGPVDHDIAVKLNVLRPHLARAAALSGRLDMMRAKATLSALQLLELPTAVLTASGKVLEANTRMAALMPSVVQDGRSQ